MALVMTAASPYAAGYFVLLVLFWAYTMQVKNQPFMSSVERKIVVLEHRAKVENGDGLHVMLASRIKVAEEQMQNEYSRRRGKSKMKATKSFQKRKSGLEGIMERVSKGIDKPKKQHMNCKSNLCHV